MSPRLHIAGWLALLGLALLMTSPALAHSGSAARLHRVGLSGEIETLSTTGKIAVAGTKDTDAGILDGTVAGSPRWGGAVRQVVTWGRALAITAKGMLFAADGSLRYRLTGRFTPGPGGIKLSGTLTVTAGTGRYAGAHGHLRVTGLAMVGGGATKSTFDLTGTLRYP